jgi:hypothetical protein
MLNIYHIGFILCTVHIIYYLIINTITIYNQIKKSDIFIAECGNNFYPDTDLDKKSYFDSYNDTEFNQYKNCLLCKLIGLDLINLNRF